MQHIPLFLAAGAACCAALAWFFPNAQKSALFRYLLLAIVGIITAISMSFCYLIGQYFFLFSWMSLLATLLFQALILFLVFGMLFGLDYNEMAQQMKRKLRGK